MPPSAAVQRPASSSVLPPRHHSAREAPQAAVAAPPQPRLRAKQPTIYPSWWPNAGEGASRSRGHRQAPGASSRPPPRLAYSRPPTAPASVARDDLPTAAFLLVPPRVSSGRGPQAQAQVRQRVVVVCMAV